jgi:microcystin degradation protein MlrC
MARIGIAGFLHETNTFAPGLTAYEQFVEADAWPGLVTGARLLDETRGMNLAVSGFVAALARTAHEPVPLVWCSANPSGIVAQTAFDKVVGQIESLLDAAPPVDALFLDLHGAMVTEKHDDAEGVLLERLRARLGPDLPIVAALDFHANLSQRMVENTSGLIAYRTYPHVDMAETGARAARFLDHLLREPTPARAFRKLPYVIPMPWQSTLADPMDALMRLAIRTSEADHILEAQIVPGFPLADVADSGPGILVYADTRPAAEAAADALHAAMQSARDRFSGRLYSIQEAMSHVLDASPGQRFILADTQDNPGGGGAGDTTDLLRALHDQDVRNACAGVVCDPAFAAAAHEAGPGRVLDMALGGHSGIGGPGLQARYEVMQTGNGRFTGTGPFYLGCNMDLGPMARVRLGGLDIIVSSRKQQAADQAMFRHVGAEPASYRILALKSSVHFRADFAALADEILVVEAPGANIANLHTLRYRHLLPGTELL